MYRVEYAYNDFEMAIEIYNMQSKLIGTYLLW